jgi:hypothetical protein
VYSHTKVQVSGTSSKAMQSSVVTLPLEKVYSNTSILYEIRRIIRLNNVPFTYY